MAKKSKIAANERRKQTVAQYAQRRQLLKEKLRRAQNQGEREAVMRELSKLPKDASPVRVRHRDSTDGRARGYLRKFGVSRITMRAMAHRGELPGVTKSSW